MQHRLRIALAGALLCTSSHAPLIHAEQIARQPDPNTRVPEGHRGHAASVYPDRIVATPAQDAAHGFAVAWRTDTGVTAPRLEIVVAHDSPDLGEGRPRVIVAATHT